MYLLPWRFASAAEKTTASKDLSSIRRREEEKRALLDGGISRMIIKVADVIKLAGRNLQIKVQVEDGRYRPHVVHIVAPKQR